MASGPHLIVGGSGTLGRALASRLLAAGEKVRVMTRNPARAAGASEIVAGDLLDSNSLLRACEGAETVVAAAHSLFGRGRSASRHVDGEGNRQLIDAARQAGVRHFVFISLYDYGPQYHNLPFFRAKYDTERYLERSGLSYTIVRPTAFMEPHAHTLIGVPVLEKGKVFLLGRGEMPRNFVAPEDVAEFVVLALRDSSLARQTLNLGGPENLTNLDVVRLYEKIAGRRAKVRRVPLAVPRIAAPMIGPLHPGVSQVLRMAVLAEEVDQRFDAGPLRKRFGVELTPLETWVKNRVRPSHQT